MKTRLILSSSLVAAALSAVGMLAAFAQNASPRQTGDRPAASGRAKPQPANRPARALRPVILAAYGDSSPDAQDPLAWQNAGPRVEGRGQPAAPPHEPVGPGAAFGASQFPSPQAPGPRSPAAASDVLRLPPVEQPVAPAPRPQTRVLESPRVEQPFSATPPVEKPVIDNPPAETPRAEPPRAEPPRAEPPRAEPPRAEPPRAENQRVAVPWGESPRDERPRVVSNPQVVGQAASQGSVIVNPFFGGPLATPEPLERPVVEKRVTEDALPQEALPDPVVPEKPLADKPAVQPPWSAESSRQPGPTMIAPLQTRQPAEQVEPSEPEVEEPSPRVTAQHEPPLPPGVAQRRRRAVSAVVHRADELTRNGFRLAQRRAFYSARTEFIRALEVIAEALDADRNTNRHSRALAAGLRALEEVDDFLPRGTATGAEIQVARIAASHQTPVLKGDAEGELPVRARQKYYSYAQQQLADAVGNVPSGSTALYGLGKLYGEIQSESSPLILDPGPKMMSLQQAALMVDPQNWRAANELGVLLARLQRLEEARGWLEHSVTLSRQHESWHNLQVVLAQLNEKELAQHAGRQAAQLARAKRGAVASRVQWIEPEAFSHLPVDEPGGSRSPRGAQSARTAEAPANDEGGMFQWLPWK